MCRQNHGQNLEQHIPKSSKNAPFIIHSDNSDSSDENSYDPEQEQEDDKYDESFQEEDESSISFENSELDSEFEQKEKRYCLRKRFGQNKQYNESQIQIQNSQTRSQQRSRTRSNQKSQYQVQDKKLQQINDLPKKLNQKSQFVNINYKIRGMEEDLAIMQNLKDNSLLKSLKTLFSDGITHGCLNLKLPKLFCERLIAYIKSFKLDLYQQAIDEIGVENIHLRDKWWKAKNAQQLNFINYACNLRN
ncbi:hypothetical protein PPERSA_05294 [Pseudocohnilembus persalinus]|uniref:Uncharacterized protein n=1 Tax=Pseudocohnilembus persalinus TaxID=266149 RepID=A0A0V0R5Y7_PSEPJ|nr:hypothetical protein PPERSA_05294 [Pseudocohnilembus persalinus]|eukprot:KRX09902.1 hypothetical protein PPERSA_05294 [Pseudocohnilembus persalinus]